MEPAIAGFGAVGQGLARMFARKGVEVVVVAAQTATRGSRAAGEAGASCSRNPTRRPKIRRSRVTVREAINLLEIDGVLTSRQGRGRFRSCPARTATPDVDASDSRVAAHGDSRASA